MRLKTIVNMIDGHVKSGEHWDSRTHLHLHLDH
jgi:hypothetical protein